MAVASSFEKVQLCSCGSSEQLQEDSILLLPEGFLLGAPLHFYCLLHDMSRKEDRRFLEQLALTRCQRIISALLYQIFGR